MSKHKQRKQQVQRRREHKRGQRNRHKPGHDSGRAHESTFRLPSLEPPEPQRCFPPLVLDASGEPVPDPHVALGVPRDADEPAILAAWQARSRECAPEDAPRLLAARDRLLDPERVIERELGVLHVPDPVAFGLPTTAPTGQVLALQDRLIGQLALYALLEATLARDEPRELAG